MTRPKRQAKTVRKWVNIYGTDASPELYIGCLLFDTKKQAIASADEHYVAACPIHLPRARGVKRPASRT
jgi:hypothetical protein